MQHGSIGWVGNVIDNGIDIGLITIDRERERDPLVWSTAALLRAGDAWWVEKAKTGIAPDDQQPWILIPGLWGVPPHSNQAVRA